MQHFFITLPLPVWPANLENLFSFFFSGLFEDQAFTKNTKLLVRKVDLATADFHRNIVKMKKVNNKKKKKNKVKKKEKKVVSSWRRMNE